MPVGLKKVHITQGKFVLPVGLKKVHITQGKFVYTCNIICSYDERKERKRKKGERTCVTLQNHIYNLVL